MAALSPMSMYPPLTDEGKGDGDADAGRLPSPDRPAPAAAAWLGPGRAGGGRKRGDD